MPGRDVQPGRDEETVVTRDGNPVATFTDVAWLPPGSTAEVWLGDVPAEDRLCSASFVFPFDDARRMLLADVIKRGLDIPGGRIERDATREETSEETAVREAAEETGAAIRILGKVGHLRLHVPNPPPGFRYPTPIAFQPFYAAAIEGMGPVQMPDECRDPIWADPREVAEDPRFRLHRELILAAVEMAAAHAPPAPTGR